VIAGWVLRRGRRGAPRPLGAPAATEPAEVAT
jgi:hypothetical protein